MDRKEKIKKLSNDLDEIFGVKRWGGETQYTNIQDNATKIHNMIQGNHTLIQEALECLYYMEDKTNDR